MILVALVEEGTEKWALLDHNGVFVISQVPRRLHKVQQSLLLLVELVLGDFGDLILPVGLFCRQVMRLLRLCRKLRHR